MSDHTAHNEDSGSSAEKKRRRRRMSIADNKYVMQRNGYRLVFAVSDEAHDGHRIDNGVAPLLFNHWMNYFIGRLVGWETDDSKLYFEFEFDDGNEHNDIALRVAHAWDKHILNGSSIGIAPVKMTLLEEDEENNNHLYEMSRYTTIEGSIVTQPANPTVGSEGDFGVEQTAIAGETFGPFFMSVDNVRRMDALMKSAEDTFRRSEMLDDTKKDDLAVADPQEQATEADTTEQSDVGCVRSRLEEPSEHFSLDGMTLQNPEILALARSLVKEAMSEGRSQDELKAEVRLMKEKYDSLILPHQDNYDVDAEIAARREQGRSDFELMNFVRLADPSVGKTDLRHEAYKHDRMKEPYSGMTLMDLRGPSEMGSTNRLSEAIGRGTVVGEAWIPFDVFFGKARLTKEQREAHAADVYGIENGEWSDMRLDLSDVHGQTKDFTDLTDRFVVGEADAAAGIGETVRMWQQAMWGRSMILGRMEQAMGLIEDLKVPFVGPATVAWQKSDETDIAATDTTPSGKTATPHTVVSGIKTTGLANHQTRGRHNRAQEASMRASMMDALEKVAQQGGGTNEPTGLLSLATTAVTEHTLSADVPALSDLSAVAKMAWTPVAANLGVGIDPGSNGGGTPGRMWMANPKTHGNLAGSIRVTNVAAALNAGMVDLGNDMAPVVMARHFVVAQKTSLIAYGLPRLMLACYWGPGIQAFIVRDPSALTNYIIVLACWFDCVSNYASYFGVGEKA